MEDLGVRKVLPTIADVSIADRCQVLVLSVCCYSEAVRHPDCISWLQSVPDGGCRNPQFIKTCKQNNLHNMHVPTANLLRPLTQATKLCNFHFSLIDLNLHVVSMELRTPMVHFSAEYYTWLRLYSISPWKTLWENRS